MSDQTEEAGASSVSSSAGCAQAGDEMSDFEVHLQNAHAWDLAYAMGRCLENEMYEKAAKVRDAVRNRRDELDDTLVEEVLKSETAFGRKTKLAFRPEKE
jgi:hypothetical protein